MAAYFNSTFADDGAAYLVVVVAGYRVVEWYIPAVRQGIVIHVLSAVVDGTENITRIYFSYITENYYNANDQWFSWNTARPKGSQTPTPWLDGWDQQAWEFNL